MHRGSLGPRAIKLVIERFILIPALRARVVSYALGAYKVYIERVVM